MYPDNTLTPKEAIRLCALGTLALGPSHYSALAGAVRHFVGRVLGPSLDLMGTSIELLKYEGLVEAMGGDGMADDAELIITDAGRDELHVLLTANLRTSASELNDLLTALKFRFLHLLNRDDQQAQADMLVDICDGELARLDDLRQYHAADDGFLVRWLDHDIGRLEEHLTWLKDFRAGLDG